MSEARQATGSRASLAAGIFQGAAARVLGSVRGIAAGRLLVAVLCIAGALVARGQATCENNGKYLPMIEIEDEPTSYVEENPPGTYRWIRGFESVGWKPLVWNFCDSPSVVQPASLVPGTPLARIIHAELR